MRPQGGRTGLVRLMALPARVLKVFSAPVFH